MSAELSPEQLVALNRLTVVARVLAGTAHDVNNALQIISGSAEMLAGLGEVGSPARRAVDRIQAQATRAAAAVGDVMQFARDRGGATGRVSLRDVVSKALGMRAFSIRRAGLVLDFDAATAPAAIVTGSGVRLQQAVLNLIINAEHASQGTAGGSISLDLTETRDRAVLRIIDQGRGLDPDVADRAFEPFISSGSVPDASGLGLTAARIIARDHSGDITFETRPKGSCVVLQLPLSR
jgi:signal transduction histidine kinase